MRQIILQSLWAGLLMAGSFPFAVAGVDVGNTQIYTHSPSGLKFFRGQVKLPVEGIWRIKPALTDPGPFYKTTLTPPPQLLQMKMSKRGKQIQQRRQLRNGAAVLRSLYWRLRTYASKHDGKLPDSFKTLTAVEGNQYLKNMLEKWPYKDSGTTPPPPYFALVGSTRFQYPEDTDLKANKWTLPVNKDPLVVELHPLYPDGKHYVLYTDGRVERVAIDTAVMTANTITVTIPPKKETVPADATTVAYSICALGSENKQQTFTLVNSDSDDTLTCAWNSTGSQPVPEPDLASFLKKTPGFLALPTTYDSPIMENWPRIQHNLLGLPQPNSPRRNRRRRGNTTNMFNVFGGRAAMRETFQMAALQARAGRKPDQVPVPLTNIERIKVKSHPFDDMLGKAEGGRIALADLTPADRFFLYFAQPKAVLPLLDEGGALMSRLGAGISGQSLNYGLQKKYFARLGITEDFVKQLIQADVMAEFALFLPDLFVIDGTDVTALIRVRDADVFSSMLSLIGAGKPVEGNILAIRGAGGYTSYWSVKGDVFVVGTNKDEVRKVMTLADKNGAGSLGNSAEFRYMLTQLPVGGATRAYAYFSDPFIRRLISPEVKIGQLRRLNTLADLQTAAAAALLYQAYGESGIPTVDRLRNQGYLPKGFDIRDISLDQDLVARSNRYGTLNRHRTLLEMSVAKATPTEAEAYKNYVRNYSRYWRRFFDPIAMRFDETGDRELEITTFILPLLDHSLYNQLKDIVTSTPSGRQLRIPQLAPTPAAMLSLNLSDKVWVDFLQNFFHEFAGRRQPVDGKILAMLDDLGPAVHFAIHDSNPIIAFGSGELMGIGGDLMEFDDDMLAIPLVISILTRPVTLAVELKKEDAVRDFLESGSLARLAPFSSNRVNMSHYKLQGKDAWIYALSIWGVNLRYQLALDDGFLLISNLPWGPDARIGRVTDTTTHCAELQLNPGVAVKQMAPMFTATMERQRQLGIQGIVCLGPLVRQGLSVDEAIARHRQLFGFAPVHPQGGHWLVSNGQLKSSLFGTLSQPEQPPYREGDRDFGLLRGVDTVRVGLQFEDEGLRTTIRWRLSGE